MIRSALMKSVLDALSSHPYLAIEDFKIEEYNNKNGEPCLTILYRYNSSWLFRFHIPNSKSKIKKDESWERYWFNCTMNPGRESFEESINAEERQGLIQEIQEWLRRLYEDILSAPIVRQFEDHSSAIEKMRVRLDKLPDEPLSKDDISKFREGLDNVKSEISEQLKQVTEDKEEVKQKLEELSRDIEFLKRTLESMTKRQWGDILLVRLRKWQQRFSLRQVSAGTKVLKALLPPEASNGLDIISDVSDGLADIIENTGNKS